ncbi:hypothetical protein [Mycolicibacterium lacusdiani]|uniref:hypothetical protein n=1 Tax=Mycolicibacterium lacusdiani TaxID=2895283 RepID=UPI001F1A3F14|nr:hypothetical protein [Mycolicibacterium lacusdiani]
MWSSFAGIALIAFIVLAVVAIVTVFIRNSRAKGFPTVESSSHYEQARGAMPPMPRPEWADDVEQGAPNTDYR